MSTDLWARGLGEIDGESQNRMTKYAVNANRFVVAVTVLHLACFGLAVTGPKASGRQKSAEVPAPEARARLSNILASVKKRFEPQGIHGAMGFSWEAQMGIIDDLNNRRFAEARKKAWSIVNLPVGNTLRSEVPYVVALTDLVILEGKAGHLGNASKLAAAAVRLTRLSDTDADGKLLRSYLLQDLAYWVSRFGIGKPAAKGRYLPKEDPLMPTARTRSERLSLGLGKTGEAELRSYLELCRRTGADECLVLLRGHIVAEWYSDRFFGGPVDVASATKSITGLVSAIAEGDGKLKQDQLVGAYLPTWKGGFCDLAFIRNVLDMTAGMPDASELQHVKPNIDDMDRAVAAMHPIRQPGNWAYSDADVQLLDPILNSALGMPVSRFARKRLFDPLGIPKGSGFDIDSRGNTILWAGAKFRAREIGRLGQLILNKGRWQGKAIIPESWIQETAFDSSSGYGNLFWIENDANSSSGVDVTHAIKMMGAASNDCAIFPEQQLVVVRLQQFYWTSADTGYGKNGGEALKSLARAIQLPKRTNADLPGEPPTTTAWHSVTGEGVSKHRGTYDYSQMRCVRTLTTGTSGLQSVAFSQNGLAVAGGGSQGVCIWDSLNGKLLTTLGSRDQGCWVRSVAFAPDSETVAVAGEDYSLTLWNAVAGKGLGTLMSHPGYGSLESVAFSRNGAALAIGSQGGFGENPIKVWDIRQGSPPKMFLTPQDAVYCVALSPNGSKVAGGSSENTVRVWDVGSSELKQTFTCPGNRGWISSMAFAPDGSQLACASSDGNITLWNIGSGRLVKQIKRQSSAVYSIAFSPDGAFLAAGSADDAIRLWDVQADRVIATLKGHTGAVNSVAFSPDGSMLASGGEDDALKLWKAPARQ